nr:hypothetical protein [Tanacetum cinerariifolium]
SDKSDNKKHDEKAKRDDKGKSHVDSLTGVRKLRAEFKEFSFNSSNRVNAVSASVNAVGLNSTNSSNSFTTASPSVNAASLNFRIEKKSSFVVPSKYPDDPDMPELQDIVYSDDEEDVGAEADLSNLETNIHVSPIPTTIVHKDHHVNQIIGDLNSAPQTRSMTRMVKEQGGLHQINDEDFHTCMFACFLSQEEPKKVLQALKDPASTPTETEKPLLKDPNGEDVDVHTYRSDKSDNKKHDEKAKRDDKGKSHVDSLTGVRKLRAEFKEFSFNSSNRVNAVSASVNAVGLNSTNSSNSFTTASPSVNAASLNFRIEKKSSFVVPSKYPDDPDMPELQDIVYSDDEEDVGAEADLSNLETNIHVSPIPTTIVHKDHHVNQIIGDLNSAPQTRSMTRMVKEQGGLHQINDEDFHTCMFACFLSQEEPKKVLQALKDPGWIKAMQEELLQFKL